MTLPRLLVFSLQNLWRRKLRSILTIWGMSVGVGAMVLLISFASGLEKQVKKGFSDIVSLTQLSVTKERQSLGTSGSGQKYVTDGDVEKLKKVSHVKSVHPTFFLGGTEFVWKDKSYNTFIQPVALDQLSDSRKKSVSRGSWWANDNDQALVLSQQTLDKNKLKAEDLVGQKVKLKISSFSGEKLNEYDATVVGILKSESSFSGLVGDAIAQEFAEKINKETPPQYPGQPAKNEYQSITVQVDDKEQVAQVKKDIEAAGLFASGSEEFLKQIDQQFLIMKIVLGVIGSIALFVALIGIANSMLMAVLERTREIGIMKAVGASRRTISWLFLSESAWLGLFGAVLGVGGAYLLGRGIVTGINFYMKSKGQENGDLAIIQFSIGLTLLLATLIGSVLITLLAGWLPARRAAGQDPVKALRYE